MEKGFTVIELLVVIGITVILALTAAPIYGNFQSSAQLNAVSVQITQDIRLVKQRSLSGLNGLTQGIKFAAGGYTIYQGESYAARATIYDRVVNLTGSLTLTTTLPGNEINFSKGLGAPDNTGAVTITHSVN